jgi:four helix bundle protein
MGEGFERLEVWKKGARLAMDIYRAFSACRGFGFKDQVCRAAVWISRNIAEGYERNSPVLSC